MSYPSFLWLRDAADRTPAHPEATLTDLLGDTPLRPRSTEILRVPCRAEEIPMRQGLFRRMLTDPAFDERIIRLTGMLSDAELLAGEYARAEIPEERVLLFVPLMRRCFDIVRLLAEFDGDEGRAGEIGAFWKKWLEMPAPAHADKRADDLFAKYDPAIQLKIHGSEASAWERRRGVRDDFERIIREMGLEDALPAWRHPQRTTPTVVRGVAGVHYAYYEAAQSYLAESGEFLPYGDGAQASDTPEERDLHGLFDYIDEFRFLTDLAAYFRSLAEMDYPLCWPAVSDRREFVIEGAVDPSLSRRGIRGTEVVPNDILMAEEKGGEQLNFYILSGANGGGKTTYLRTAALAALFFTAGCPVTARGGRSMPFDAVYTHFPSNESFESGGRFADESVRADKILEEAGPDSFAVFNETYSGTDERRSEEFSKRLAETMYRRGTFGIYVTHIHSLTGGEIPTLAAVIDEADENRRTYKIRRVGGTSSSFARDILEKYGLDAASLEKRLAERRASERTEGGA